MKFFCDVILYSTVISANILDRSPALYLTRIKSTNTETAESTTRVLDEFEKSETSLLKPVRSIWIFDLDIKWSKQATWLVVYWRARF